MEKSLLEKGIYAAAACIVNKVPILLAQSKHGIPPNARRWNTTENLALCLLGIYYFPSIYRQPLF
jgi:hypothetical protein